MLGTLKKPAQKSRSFLLIGNGLITHFFKIVTVMSFFIKISCHKIYSGTRSPLTINGEFFHQITDRKGDRREQKRYENYRHI